MLTHTCQGQLYFRTSEIINKVKVTDEKKKKKEDIFALNMKTILRLSSLFTSHKINCSSRCLKTTREIKGLKQNSNCYGERFVKINVDLSQFRCMPSSLEVQYYLVWFRSSVPGQIKLIRYAQSVFFVIFDEFVLIDQQRKLISVATIYEANFAPLRCKKLHTSCFGEKTRSQKCNSIFTKFRWRALCRERKIFPKDIF